MLILCICVVRSSSGCFLWEMKVMIYFSQEFSSHLFHLHFCSWFLFERVDLTFVVARDSVQHVMLILNHETMKPPTGKIPLTLLWFF